MAIISVHCADVPSLQAIHHAALITRGPGVGHALQEHLPKEAQLVFQINCNDHLHQQMLHQLLPTLHYC